MKTMRKIEVKIDKKQKIKIDPCKVRKVSISGKRIVFDVGGKQIKIIKDNYEWTEWFGLIQSLKMLFEVEEKIKIK